MHVILIGETAATCETLWFYVVVKCTKLAVKTARCILHLFQCRLDDDRPCIHPNQANNRYLNYLVNSLQLEISRNDNSDSVAQDGM